MVESLHLLLSLWPNMIMATVLFGVGMGVGMSVGHTRSIVIVRGVQWWVANVIIPLLYKRSWLIKFLTILVNNMTILIGIVMLGTWSSAAIAGIAMVGFSMGIALRVFSNLPESFVVPNNQGNESDRRRFRIGMLLNLLEPPAIIIALGVALGRTSAPMTDEQGWAIVLYWVFPAMLLAAGGEALWMGVAIRKTASASGSSSNGV